MIIYLVHFYIGQAHGNTIILKSINLILYWVSARSIVRVIRHDQSGKVKKAAIVHLDDRVWSITVLRCLPLFDAERQLEQR